MVSALPGQMVTSDIGDGLGRRSHLARFDGLDGGDDTRIGGHGDAMGRAQLPIVRAMSRRDMDEPRSGLHIDEIAGQWAVLLFVPVDLIHYGIGFVLFRAFDIFKPWPVGWADREVKGGLGIMLDDVLAAVYAALVLWGVAWVMPQALGG